MVLERLINLGYGTQAIRTGFIKTLNVLEVLNKTFNTLSEKTESVFVSYNLSGMTWLLLNPKPSLDIFFVACIRFFCICKDVWNTQQE